MARIQRIEASARRTLRAIAAAAAIAIAIGIGTASRGAAAEAQDFLVAKPDLGDPLFEESVILMLPAPSAEIVSGVIINKPTTIAVKQVFPHSGDLNSPSDVVYFGGPVGLEATLMVRRTTTPAEGEIRVFGDLYLSVDPKKIAAILKDPALDKSNVRIFEGYATWSAPQLHREKIEDSWYEVPVTFDAIFSGDPKQLWKEMAARGRMQQVNWWGREFGRLQSSLELPFVPRQVNR